MKEHLKKKGGDALKRHLDAKEAHKHDTPAEKSSHKEKPSTFTGCPGQRIRSIMHRNEESATSADNGTAPVSQLSQWPVQIKLAPINAPYFDGANLLIETTALHTLTLISTTVSSATALLSSDVRSWMLSITLKN